MTRTSKDQFVRGRLMDGYDYKNQAWVVGGRYVDCGHPREKMCSCYGRAHAGEPTTPFEHKLYESLTVFRFESHSIHLSLVLEAQSKQPIGFAVLLGGKRMPIEYDNLNDAKAFCQATIKNYYDAECERVMYRFNHEVDTL